VVNEGTPKPDCTARVNFDRNADMPGYSVERNGRRACLPFMPTNQLVPPDYKGRDFYGEAFTDQAIKARWTECKKDSACAERVIAGAKPFISAEKRDTGVADAVGKIDPEAEVDLKAIRRPAFFGKAAYNEAIAAAEPRTFTVKFTVPRDNYERLHLKKGGSLKLRGWYLQGAGVDDGAGRRIRALVVMNNGGGSEITAIDDPAPKARGEFLGHRNVRGPVADVDDCAAESPGLVRDAALHGGLAVPAPASSTRFQATRRDSSRA
jgi:hypothetical protein